MSREDMPARESGAWGESTSWQNPGKEPRAHILEYDDRVSERGKK